MLYHLYLREVGELKLLTREEEVTLARRVRRGDDEARERMIKANLRLVVRIAHGFEGHGLPLLDLISEGNIGLMKAVERYNPSRGTKFSTYAAWWIKQHIRRAVSNQLRTVRLPVHAQEKLMRIQRIAEQLRAILGRDPSDSEIADQTGLPARKVTRLREAAVRPLSLDELRGDDDSRSLAETVADETVRHPGETFEANSDMDVVRGLLAELEPREQAILRGRFGLDGDGERTLGEIGGQIGITREYVRQLQNRALKKLRNRLSLDAE
jgi:RNA polymerase primary sigma factor